MARKARRNPRRDRQTSFAGHWLGEPVQDTDHDLVFQPSRWQRLLWRDASETISGDNVTAMAEKLMARPDGPKLPREVFSRLYGHPERLTDEEIRPEDRWARTAHEALDEIPEFEQVRQRCQGDEAWSAMTTVHLTTAALAAIPEPTKAERKTRQARQKLDGLQGLLDACQQQGADGDGESDGSQDGSGEPGQAERDLQDEVDAAQMELDEAIEQLQQQPGPDPSEMRQKLRNALEEAQEEIQDAEDAEAALGGSGYDPNGTVQHGKGDPKARVELAKRLREDPEIRRILKEAGRLRRLHADKRATRSHHAPEELCDIEIGDELGRLLPSELMGLKHPKLKKLLRRKLLEKQAMQYRLRGTEKLSKGPIITCVDESGSMSGDRNIWAKAVALAMLTAADKDRRGWGLIKFDTRVTGDSFAPAGRSRSAMEILEALSTFAGGGTDWMKPLDAARKRIETESDGLRDADVILITDGACATNPEWRRKWLSWKEEAGVTLYVVLIGCYSADTAEELGDEVVHVQSTYGNKPDDAGFVDQVLGSI